MQTWALLQFAGALAVIVSCIALIIGKLHIIERAGDQKLWEKSRQNIARMGQP